jgi:methyl-accepting chemotaxis protein
MSSLISRVWAHRLRFGVRLVAAMLVVSVPLMVVLAWLLTSSASSSLTSAAEDRGGNVARAVTLHVEDWLSERQEYVSLLAGQASGRLGTPAAARLLTGAQRYNDYQSVEMVDRSGRVLASSRAGQSVPAAGQAWLRTALSGKTALESPVVRGGGIQWILAEPVVGAGGHVEGAVVANLNPTQLAGLLNPELDGGTQVVAVDADGRLVYDTKMKEVADTAAMISAGSLQSSVDNAAIRAAKDSGEPGSIEFTDAGTKLVGGYDVLDDLKWVIVAQGPADVVLAPVHNQVKRAVIIVLIGTLLAIGAALFFGTREARKLRQLADETSASGVDVNSAAAELSASSDELAATTTQQSAAVTEATSTTEELARASAAIADTVDDVAAQTAETKDNLEQAEADITLSSERTLALAHKVNDIDALLDLINEIADQTNLLALNAAIEAARAGENGLGFAVVADEVRRLAERSKTSAGEINVIIRAVQGETNATVMAMEKGAKQMQRGLTLLEAVTDANAQVRMTTQQQRSATAQVVETMEQLNDSSRQVSATADQIASAAGNLADLAGNLETTATTAKDRY